jgi:serine/threonine-protein kinase BUR1
MTFLREVKILRALRHPNIVQLREVISGNSKKPSDAFLVFEYVEYDLQDVLRWLSDRGLKLPPESVRHYLRQLAEALRFCHAHGVIHRDVKVCRDR